MAFLGGVAKGMMGGGPKQQMMQQKPMRQGIGPSQGAMRNMGQMGAMMGNRMGQKPPMGQMQQAPLPPPQMMEQPPAAQRMNPMMQQRPPMGSMRRPMQQPYSQGMQNMFGSQLGQPPMQQPEPPPEYRQAGEAAGNDMSWMDRQRDMQSMYGNMAGGGPQQAMRQSPMMPRFMGPLMRNRM